MRSRHPLDYTIVIINYSNTSDILLLHILYDQPTKLTLSWKLSISMIFKQVPTIAMFLPGISLTPI